MDKVFELSRRERFDALLLRKRELAKSNNYYHEIHPTEAADVDAKLVEAAAAAARKKAAAAAPAAGPAGTGKPAAAGTTTPQTTAVDPPTPAPAASEAISPAPSRPPPSASPGPHSTGAPGTA